MVMPPRVAPTQLIAVPIPNAKLAPEARAALSAKAKDLCALLAAAGVRVDSDLRDNYTPGWKYNYWELKVRALSPPPAAVWASPKPLSSCTVGMGLMACFEPRLSGAATWQLPIDRRRCPVYECLLQGGIQRMSRQVIRPNPVRLSAVQPFHGGRLARADL